MKIIGLGHQKRTGKDTVANFMVDYLREKGYVAEKVGFADELKEQCYHLFSWAGLKWGNYYEGNPEEREKILPGIYKTPRQIWIEYGQAVCSVYLHTWVDFVFNKYKKYDFLIIKDVRKLFEISRILDEKGNVFKVINPSIPHTSDVIDDQLLGYTGWDDVLINNGTLDDLKELSIKTLKKWYKV
jgi:hypothetical protein